MSDPIALIEAHLAAVEAAVLDEDAPMPAPPELAGLEIGPERLDEAIALLERVNDATDRLIGLRRRVRGEIEDVRRPRSGAGRRAPRTVDVTA